MLRLLPFPRKAVHLSSAFGTRRLCRSLALVAMLLAGASGARAADDAKRTPVDLARWIDERFEASWKAQGIVPAPRTSDSEFVRRVHLDLIGRIPSVAEVRSFLEDERPDKRERLVESLLQHGALAAHFANSWRDLMLAGESGPEARALAPALETWLRLRFTANMPYDQLVTEVLTAPLDAPNPANDRNVSRVPSPRAFYVAAGYKPEQLAASASRLFLSVQVQCAQCHDHPFAEWKQPQFWSLAAFFTDLEPGNGRGTMMERKENDFEGIKIPEKDVIVPALFLDGSRPDRETGQSKRQALARWITSSENPYFAKAVVNRVWDHFFGRGFVHPVDDLDLSRPSAFPEVFSELANQFVRHGYDIHYLIRVMVATRAYHLSSRGVQSDAAEQQTEQFARMPLRRMTSDQLFASFIQATGYREAVPQNNRQVFQPDGSARAEFQTKFGDTGPSRLETEATILQALSLMNGKYVAAAIDPEQSETLAAVENAPYLDTKGKIETLFLATLSRPPDAEELATLLAHADAHPSAESAEKKTSALADVFWMLLNSAEFLLNH